MAAPDELIEEYPILSTRIANIADYVAPADYSRLLKPYSAQGIDDLGIFRRHISSLAGKAGQEKAKFDKVLELGCGPGRSTQAFMDEASAGELHLLDLSPKMMERIKARYSHLPNVSYVHSDTIDYLGQSEENYDLIYSLWSFSHSVHQILIGAEPEKGKLRVTAAIRRMVEKMMKPGAGFFMIHVDSKSDEQTILFRQWAKIFPIFRNESSQTPSKLILDAVLGDLEREGIIDYESEHVEMDPIEYESMDELLDIFLNFHLESHFNNDPEIGAIINEIRGYAAKFQTGDDRYAIRPGCFIYKLTKK
jgi:SAM-dependent methyltransferase